MKSKNLDIRKELYQLSDEKYRKFATSLIPGCDNLIGVRIPEIRKIAKKIIKDNAIDFLDDYEDACFEETMLKGLVIGNKNEDIEIVLEQVSLFIPKITNWSLCDSFCNELKIVRKHKERVWNFLQRYHHSNECYEVRFLVVILLFHYIEEKYLDGILSICDNIKHEDYYVKMAIAWAISMCFAKFPKETMPYLQENNLDKETYNKALQKIRESLQVDKETNYKKHEKKIANYKQVRR